MSEFLGALARQHTYSPRNPYFLFGLAWGASLPLVMLAVHAWLNGQPIPVRQLVPNGASAIYVTFPVMFAAVFGALGTVRRDKQRMVNRTIHFLDREVATRTKELVDTYAQTVLALSQAIEAKDPYTRGHCLRVWQYAERAAVKLGVANGDLQTLKYACFLHDVGKIRIPGRLLNKPDALSADEYEIIRLHPVYSERIVAHIQHFRPVAELVRHHHERNDGTGYPDGLRGDELSLLAKILIAADAMDAMTSDRPYRSGCPTAVAMEELKRCADLAFDRALLPNAGGPVNQLDREVVLAMVESLVERPLQLLPPGAATREDVQIADYLAHSAPS